MSYRYNKGFLFEINEYENGVRKIQMADEYDELSDIISLCVKEWVKAQERNDALPYATRRAIERLRDNATALLKIADECLNDTEV